jgi:hypothetical protein
MGETRHQIGNFLYINDNSGIKTGIVAKDTVSNQITDYVVDGGEMPNFSFDEIQDLRFTYSFYAEGLVEAGVELEHMKRFLGLLSAYGIVNNSRKVQNKPSFKSLENKITDYVVDGGEMPNFSFDEMRKLRANIKNMVQEHAEAGVEPDQAGRAIGRIILKDNQKQKHRQELSRKHLEHLDKLDEELRHKREQELKLQKVTTSKSVRPFGWPFVPIGSKNESVSQSNRSAIMSNIREYEGGVWSYHND